MTQVINGDNDKKIYVTFSDNSQSISVGLFWDLGKGNEWYLDKEGKKLEHELLNAALFKAMTPDFKAAFCSNLVPLFSHMRKSPTVCII